MKKTAQTPEQAPLSPTLKAEAKELLKKLRHHTYSTEGIKQQTESLKAKKS